MKNVCTKPFSRLMYISLDGLMTSAALARDFTFESNKSKHKTCNTRNTPSQRNGSSSLPSEVAAMKVYLPLPRKKMIFPCIFFSLAMRSCVFPMDVQQLRPLICFASLTVASSRTASPTLLPLDSSHIICFTGFRFLYRYVTFA